MQESFVPLGGASGELGVAIGGGADYGEFPFVTAAPGGGATVGDVILEIGATPVLGMTLGDVRGVLNTCPHPIRIKTVSPGKHAHTQMLLFGRHVQTHTRTCTRTTHTYVLPSSCVSFRHVAL